MCSVHVCVSTPSKYESRARALYIERYRPATGTRHLPSLPFIAELLRWHKLSLGRNVQQVNAYDEQHPYKLDRATRCMTLLTFSKA